jgi:D-beta-D-heptose 7-phosphate kinase/D-beta-D-heptose 1-phosphate adenosyltransferase
MGRVLTRPEAVAERRRLEASGRRVVFTNGVFDLLHKGHVELLSAARGFGDALFVGVNSDASTRRLKGPSRPLVPEADRAAVLAAMAAVDAVVLFDEDTPLELVRALEPDVLVKGADYAPEEIVGREVVEARGGRVERVPLVKGRSTSRLVGEITRRAASADG